MQMVSSLPRICLSARIVSLKVPGFKAEIFNDVILQVDRPVTLPVVLQPRTLTESIEVTGAVPLVETTTSSLAQVIDNKKINDLPLNGRNVWALGLLLGNAVPVRGLNTNLPFTAGVDAIRQTISCWTVSITTPSL